MTIEGVLSSQLVRLLDWEDAHTAQADILDFCRNPSYRALN